MLSQSRLTSVVTKSSGAGMGGAVGGNMSGWSAEGGHEESAVKGETGLVVKQKPGHDYYLIEEVPKRYYLIEEVVIIRSDDYYLIEEVPK